MAMSRKSKGLQPGSVVAADSFQPAKRRREGGRAGRVRPPRNRPRLTSDVNPSRLFILRPVATSLLMIAVLLSARSHTGSSAFPRCLRWIIRRFKVVTFYPGASPDVTASAITAPLERQFGPNARIEPNDVR
jgi:hypothetical protein